MTSYLWPSRDQMKLIGKRIDRVDGPAKSSGAAKYSLDINRPGLLYGKSLAQPSPPARSSRLTRKLPRRLPASKLCM
jgi:xanthine dehydrogenase YagR molybdenum-binding subunit